MIEWAGKRYTKIKIGGYEEKLLWCNPMYDALEAVIRCMETQTPAASSVNAADSDVVIVFDVNRTYIIVPDGRNPAKAKTFVDPRHISEVAMELAGDAKLYETEWPGWPCCDLEPDEWKRNEEELRRLIAKVRELTEEWKIRRD